MSQIIIKNLSVKRGESFVLKNLNLTIEKGEFVVVVGKSGSGKTTLLHTLAGFLPFSGDIIIPHNLGVVFQEYSIFPWLTVEKNISLGLDKYHPKERKEIIEEHLALTELGHKRHSYSAELSGGQIQRVAIARSLAPDPEVLLMDEPYSALDVHTRDKMQEWLLDVWQKKQKTVIFVTHNISESIFLADRVLVLDEGNFVREFVVPFTRPRVDEMRFTMEFNLLNQNIKSFL
ncbi:MAG TPA: nitrate ABC transporter ATP-binding protein [Candidatus Magasanikbacteria bacterium]|nr:nitrate ABC transporter ATP-binding protein [Candidatus Magasanikbacteria bacterium]